MHAESRVRIGSGDLAGIIDAHRGSGRCTGYVDGGEDSPLAEESVLAAGVGEDPHDLAQIVYSESPCTRSARHVDGRENSSGVEESMRVEVVANVESDNSPRTVDARRNRRAGARNIEIRESSAAVQKSTGSACLGERADQLAHIVDSTSHRASAAGHVEGHEMV